MYKESVEDVQGAVNYNKAGRCGRTCIYVAAVTVYWLLLPVWHCTQKFWFFLQDIRLKAVFVN